MSYDLIVIGAGPGGYVSAERAGHMGKKVLLIEKKFLGGVCLNWGCIPTKTLLASAKAYYSATHSEAFGVTVDNAIFNLEQAQNRKGGIIEGMRKGIAGIMKKAKVDVVTGDAVLLPNKTVQVTTESGVEEYSASNILIATGSSPARPPIPGADQAHVLDSTGILNIDTLPKQLAVIGGGVIGIEFACFFGSLGIPVTVIEMLPAICPGIDADNVKILQAELAKKNVTVHVNARVTGISERSVSFNKNDADEMVDADCVLLATGRTPNIESLQKAGLDITRSGVTIDEHCRTNLPDVYACGDVTGKIMLAHVASRQGEVAVNTMFGKDDHMRYNAIPGVIYTSPEVAGIGATEEQAQEQGLNFKAVKLPMGVSGRYQAENDKVRGQVKVIVNLDNNTILGVHMVGNLASEIIHSAAFMIETEMRVDDIKEMVFPHPTVCEVIRDALFLL